MSTRPSSPLPWRARRVPTDPFDGAEPDRLMVFVPAIMSVGVVFSVATLIRDAMQRAGRRSRERRIAVESAATFSILLGDPLPRREPAGLQKRFKHIAIAGIAGVAVVLGALTGIAVLASEFLDDLDDTLSAPIVDASWVEQLSTIDLFGSTVISIGFAAVIGLSASRCRVMALVFPSAFVFSWVTNFLLQELVERPRPVAMGDLKSFPSGHIVQAIFIAGLVPAAVDVLFGVRRRTVIISRFALGAFALMTALVRVHRQDHWPTDVLAGVLLGLTTVLIAHWLLERQHWHHSCNACPWSFHPGHADWSKGVLAFRPSQTRLVGVAGATAAIASSASLLIATTFVGLPSDPEGTGVGSAIAEPMQIALAVTMGIAGLAAVRWRAKAAFTMALCATALGLLASVEYTPLTAFVLTAMLLVPAVLTWLAWQPTATLGSIAVLAVITISSLTATALGSRQIYDHYFGPTHPESVAVPLDSEATWLWLGAVHDSTATVVGGGLDSSSTARLTYWSAGVEPRSVQASVQAGLARFEILDLQADTEYSYSVTEGPAEPNEPTAEATFHTRTDGPHNVRVVVGSCARTGSNGAVFDAMVEEEPDLYIAIGDLHYASLSSSDPADHLDEYERALTQPGQSALFRSVPTAYVWDDHDFGPDNADSTSPSRAAVSSAFRQAVPHELVDDDPSASIAQAFTVGRVRFVLTDTRSQRTPDTMLGDRQLEWLIDELISSAQTHALVVWGNPTPWISPEGADADDWSAHADERTVIADALSAANVDNLVMVSGDAHMVAIDDGSNSGYGTDGSPGFPVLHAAALDRPGSTKGGPYSHGSFPGGGQYGMIDILDDGGPTVRVSLAGLNWEGETLVTYEFTVDAADVLADPAA